MSRIIFVIIIVVTIADNPSKTEGLMNFVLNFLVFTGIFRRVVKIIKDLGEFCMSLEKQYGAKPGIAIIRNGSQWDIQLNQPLRQSGTISKLRLSKR